MPCPRYGFAVRYTFTRNVAKNGINPRAAEVPLAVKNEATNSEEPNTTIITAKNDESNR